MSKRYFDLLLAGGNIVTWTGEDAIAAARDYVAGHPGASVVATRLASGPLTVLGRGVIID